ncbi:MAG: RIP metalloprotease RseP [Candidatus Niyogibacteria bacterium]|nr:RIP metalloprotease RseP [Candidatus Niyogibacteria bacterium]
MLTTLFIFFVILVLLILSHEFGHFIFAKWNGVKVEEFGFGLPPRLFSVKKGETVYSINLLPFGGFVKIEGEEIKDDLPIGPRSFAAKSIKARAMIIAAGVFFNLILAFFIFSFGNWWGTPAALGDGERAEDEKIFIVEVQEKSPAETAGLLAGDTLLKLRSKSEELAVSKISEVQNFIKQNRGREITVFYKRDGQELTSLAKPRSETKENEGALGIVMAKIGTKSYPFHQAIWQGLKTTIFLTGAMVAGIVDFFVVLIRGEGGLGQIAGPIGIVGLVGSAASFGFLYLLQFMAFLSVNLAVINFIPFPGLDGGRLFFLAAEAIRGKPIGAKISTWAHAVGLVLLLILMLIITYNDIAKIL